MFASKRFIVSDLTFMFLTHFEFIFVFGVRKRSIVILLHVGIKLLYEPTMQPLDIHPKKAITEKETSATLFTEALFIVASAW